MNAKQRRVEHRSRIRALKNFGPALSRVAESSKRTATSIAAMIPALQALARTVKVMKG